MKLKWVWNIPNVLSIIRLLLVPVIAITYLKSNENPDLFVWAAVCIAVSGITDVADGIIARKFNQITEIGKVLDPAADKLTQLTVLICLTIRHLDLLPVMIICLFKEVCQIMGGLLILGQGAKMEQSKWFGKLSTVVFYTAASALVAFSNMPSWLTYSLGAIMAITMLFAFINYFRLFILFCKKKNSETSEE